MTKDEIPNLDLTHLAGIKYADADLHYELLGTLANLLGRDMSLHRHHDYYQVHYVKNGIVRVQLEDHFYSLNGPMVFLTPPAFLHAFVTDDDADGHVLTVQQKLLEPIFSNDAHWFSTGSNISPVCLSLANLVGNDLTEFKNLDQLFDQLKYEHLAQDTGVSLSMLLLARLIFISLLRLSRKSIKAPSTAHEELRIFHRFNVLMEDNFRSHWTVPKYASELAISEQRLNEICRQIAGKSTKQLVNYRLLQEAKRLLIYTNQAISQVGYSLGFEDPAYFGRFFQRYANQTPGTYRAEMLKNGLNPRLHN